MNKRRAHHYFKGLLKVSPWYFLALAVISGAVCVLALRSNNQQMIKLRDQVYAADRDNGDVQSALKELQTYVTSHMNTDMSTASNSVYPPVQLKYTYERLVKAKREAYSQANAQLYSDAQTYCEQQNSRDVSGRNRVPCIEQYVQSRSTQKMPVVPDALYKFDFASPTWSPDLAGWSMLIVILSGGLFFVSIVARRLTG